MTDWREYAEHYVEELRSGDSEAAYFSLVEADSSVVPLLTDACRAEADPRVRATIIEIVWQHRDPTSLGLLSEALDDDAAEVWSNALDGIVALGRSGHGDEAIALLETARRVAEKETTEKLNWIDEALEQIREKTEPTQ